MEQAPMNVFRAALILILSVLLVVLGLSYMGWWGVVLAYFTNVAIAIATYRWTYPLRVTHKEDS